MAFILKDKKYHNDSEKPESLAVAYSVKKRKAGPMKASEDDSDERPASIADGIMRKRNDAKMMAEGGEVSPADAFEDLNEEAATTDMDDSGPDFPQPMDSNEHGDSIEGDILDMVGSIRARLKAKRGL